MDFGEAVAALDARTNYERTGRLTSPTLERMRTLMDLLAEPQRSFPAIHVTGTNGKTTAARAASEVLRAAGLHVATYVSPHVQSVRERFLYDGRLIPKDDFVEAWRELAPFLDLVDSKHDKPVTWFEAATALAFLWFADKGADVAVIEVGMGGEWDATNVVDGQVALVTRVGLDHPVLGSTPAEVAREKGGVIKPGAVAVLEEQSAEAAEVLRARCAEVGAQMRAEGIAFALEKTARAVRGQVVSMRLGADRYPDVFMPMFGEHFARDAVVGAGAARAMLGDPTIDGDLVAKAFSRIKLTGRMEVVHRAPLVILDGAHNPSAAEALAVSVRAMFTVERVTLVVSVMGDKDVRGVLAPLVATADEVIVTRNQSPRAAATERLAEEVRALGRDAQIVANVADAVSVAIERSGESDCVLVTGSLYTVGEARSKLIPEEKI